MSSRKPAAASTAAMASKLGVPVSQRRGPRSAAGRTLATGSSSSSAGSAQSTPACGPYHLYGLVTRTSQPMARTSIERCGARCTASTKTRAPASWAAATIGARSGIVPSRLEAPVTATQRVRSSTRSVTAAGSRRPVAGSNGARTCSAPDWSQARRHGVTLASWSSRVPTTRSPGRSVAATARVNASVSVVMLAPKATPPAGAPSSCGDACPGALEQSVAGIGSGERAAGVGVVAARRPRGHRLDRPVDHLRARRPVEPGPPVADTWEPRPQGLRIHRRRVCHLG